MEKSPLRPLPDANRFANGKEVRTTLLPKKLDRCLPPARPGPLFLDVVKPK